MSKNAGRANLLTACSKWELEGLSQVQTFRSDPLHNLRMAVSARQRKSQSQCGNDLHPLPNLTFQSNLEPGNGESAAT